ncbi:MAG: hypothetical protein EPO28_14700 [Saprospiraceae bacterium]|nr:MAG: hypothetical protein EPO28_14700 [Saprospiraceae bacterium]
MLLSEMAVFHRPIKVPDFKEINEGLFQYGCSDDCAGRGLRYDKLILVKAISLPFARKTNGHADSSGIPVLLFVRIQNIIHNYAHWEKLQTG